MEMITRFARRHRRPIKSQGGREQRENVLGVIRERVSRVVASVDEPTVTAAVRIDAATQKFHRVAFDNLTLPLIEDDAPRILSATAMLRKKPWPSFKAARHDHGASMAPKSDSMSRQQRPNGRRGLFDSSVVIPMPIDLESVGARHPANVAITEIHPEQVTVGRARTRGEKRW